MIAGLDWWFWITVVLGTLSCLTSLVQYFRGYEPDDYSQGPMLILEAFLVVYLECYGYLVTAMLIPAGAFFYSLSERTRWATLLLAVPGPVLIVMVHRMNMLWYYY